VGIFNRFTNQNSVCYPAHRSLLDCNILTILGDLYKSKISSICIILSYSFISSIVGLNIFLGTLFQVLETVVTPCSDVVVYRSFRGTYCLHLQGEGRGSMYLWNVGILPYHYTVS